MMFKICIFLLANLVLINCHETKNVVEVKSDTICELCTSVLTVAQNLLAQNKSEIEIMQLIEKEVCGKLGDLNSTCVQYIEAYGKQILTELSDKVDPTTICHLMSLCAFKPVPYHQFIKPMVDSNSLNCTVCKLVFQQVQNLLKNNASEAQIIALIEKDLCNATGKMNTLCKTLIDDYGPTILIWIANGVDPEKVCTLIGMCTSKSDQQFKIAEERQGEIECIACEYVVKFLDYELQKNATTSDVINALDKVCKIAPASLREQCDNLVQKYGIYLIELVAQYADPAKVCIALRLCPTK